VHVVAMADVLGNSVHAMSVTFAMIGMGTALRAAGVVSPAGQRDMSQVAVKLLLPAFNFSALVSEVTWARLQSCSGVALFAVIHMVLGLALGSMLCCLCRSSAFMQRHRGQVLVLCAFCNGTAMPLTLFRALESAPQLKDRLGSAAEGALDITIYGTVWRLLLWTVGIALLEADAAQEKAKVEPPTGEEPRANGAEPRKSSFRRLVRAALLNTNTIGSVAGLAIALGPPGLRWLVFEGPLTFLREACANVAKASHAMLLLTLGAALWPIPASSDWRAVSGVCVAKLVVMPFATLALLRASTGLGLGAVGSLVVAIEGCVPSALQVSMMVQTVGQDSRTCTVICFWQHVVALLTMTTFVAVALASLF